MALTVDPALISRLENDLFAQTRFRSQTSKASDAGMTDFMTLAGNVDQAMAGMPFVSYYLIMGRAFMVNFTDSFSEIQSLLDGL